MIFVVFVVLELLAVEMVVVIGKYALPRLRGLGLGLI